MDGEPTVQEYLKARGTDFVPLGLEWTGATGKAWDPFLKKVSQAAHECNSDTSAAAFHRHWSIQLGMCLARSGADAALDRVSDLLAKSKTEGSSTIPRVEDYALSSEFDDMHGELSDFSASDDDDDHSEPESGSSDDSDNDDDDSVDCYSEST